MSANTAQQKTVWLLAALLLIQIILMSTYARYPNSEQSILRTWVMTAFTPVIRVGDSLITKVTGSVGSYTDLRNAQEENVELRERVEQLTAQLNEARERGTEYETLRNQLALPSLTQYAKLAANVISRDTNLWFKRLTIDRGSLDGVKQNMPVATATGIVGRVISVGPNFAQVQVITDKNAGVGVMLQGSRTKGELKGLDNARCELKNIPATDTVEVGEQIITTGLDRIYPKGLAVGVVERIDNDPNAPWHKIIIKPSAPVDRAEHVLVLLVEQKDLNLTMEELNK
jgi:rod shape-determining protein MreC